MELNRTYETETKEKVRLLNIAEDSYVALDTYQVTKGKVYIYIKEGDANDKIRYTDILTTAPNWRQYV